MKEFKFKGLEACENPVNAEVLVKKIRKEVFNCLEICTEYKKVEDIGIIEVLLEIMKESTENIIVHCMALKGIEEWN